jgi:hypothetical protein
MPCHNDDEMEGRNTSEETPTQPPPQPQPQPHAHTQHVVASGKIPRRNYWLPSEKRTCTVAIAIAEATSTPFVNILTPKHRHLPREVTGPQSHVIPTVLDTHHVVSKHHANNMQTAVQH